MEMADRFRSWFEYEKESHAKVLASLDAVSPEQRANPAFQKALDLLAHMTFARRLWLFRLGVGGSPVTNLFPEAATLDSIRAGLEDVQRQWSAFLATLDDAALSRRFDYQALDGHWFRNSLEEVLTQLFGHSWYHRGQIALLLRTIGAEPAVTDLIYWCREPIDVPGGEGGV